MHLVPEDKKNLFNDKKIDPLDSLRFSNEKLVELNERFSSQTGQSMR